MKTNMTWKKALALMLALVMMLTVAGCTPAGPSQEEYDSLMAEVATLQEEVDTLRSASDELQAEIDRLLEENGELTEEIEALMAALGEVDGALSEAEESLEQTSVAVQQPAAAQNPPTASSVTAVTFSKTTDLTLNVGNTNQRTATTTPAGGAVAYASSNTAVATVSTNGTVTCKTVGDTVISATSGGATASYKLTVTAAPANNNSSTASSQPSTSSGGSSTNGTGVFAGYKVTVYDKTTPASTVGGFTHNGVYAMYFTSSSGAVLGSVTESDYTKILQAATDRGQVTGKSKDWMAEQFNVYRGASGNSGGNNSSNPANQVDTDAYAEELIRLVNDKRVEYGLHELEVDAALMSHARVRAEELSISFSHTRPNGEVETSECATMGNSTPAAALKAWMNSDSHRTAILNESGRFNYNYIGAGCYQDAHGKMHWILQFS